MIKYLLIIIIYAYSYLLLIIRLDFYANMYFSYFT